MIRSSLRSYVPAVLRQWWTYVGLGASVIGYIVDLATGLTVPPVAWIGIFGGCLIVAQFRTYQEVHQRLLAYEGPRLPQWALWAHNANADGAWLTLLAVGDLPKEAFNTGIYDQLIGAAVKTFGLDRGDLRIEAFSNFLRIKSPNVDGTPEFLLQLGTDARGIVGVQWRTTADPVPLAWVVQCLNLAIRFVLSDSVARVVRLLWKGKYSVSLSNCPQNGVSIEPPISARRLSDNYVRGVRVYREFTFRRDDSDGWLAILEFAGATLSDSGYVGFESGLAQLTKPSVESK